jgi:hypothetical protein
MQTILKQYKFNEKKQAIVWFEPKKNNATFLQLPLEDALFCEDRQEHLIEDE